jgi:adenine/guanine phosphoribosyltransferase-like PRPP-binding protein
MINRAENSALVPDRDAWNLYVFRKGRNWLPVRALVDELESEIHGIRAGPGCAIDALVRAGEIETGLADVGSPDALLAAQITYQLAMRALGLPANIPLALDLLRQIDKQLQIRCSYPEGFSYYGLNPLDYADLVESIRPELPPRAAIVGIRSVGSTLGAIVAAAVERAGVPASRITVRPEGEPYQREASFTAEQKLWIQSEAEAGAAFLVVDEGPGFSGSTFLAVANALVAAGVPASRVALLCSRPFQARDGHEKQIRAWERFRSHVIRYGASLPAEADRGLGDGAWRELLYDDRSQWPPCWTELERIKHLSVDSRTLFKFEGFGRFGKLARKQAALLAEAEFSPRLFGFENGYGCYEFLATHPLDKSSLDLALILRMAQYCAFRARLFPAPEADSELLSAMASTNLALEFGIESPLADIPVERPVYPDCRMQPHEWLPSASGVALKTDATGHGEGHHLPGPVDIAWDLAGVIVEWDLDESGSAALLREFSRTSGDDASSRIDLYVFLYSIFRMAFCRMAAASLAGSEEAGRLCMTYRGYRERIRGTLRRLRAS